jgi:hypothetical protein
MWSDNESDVDLLRFAYLSRAVVRIIRTPGLLPTTIGVFGDWGSGKSTVLKMVQRELQGDPTVLAVTFNGWLFEGYEDAKTALMGSILDAIKTRIENDKSLLAKAGERLAKLLRRVDYLQGVGMAVRYLGPLALGLPHLTLASAGYDLVKVLGEKSKDFDPDELKKLLKEARGAEATRRDVREFREEFSKLLGDAEIGTLVVFIDDLDRCLPPTVIATLEAIKLFLFVPKTAFVLGADERLVQYAVRERFPELPGPEVEVGRDYLEKLVQFPVRIPPLNAPEIASYMGLLFAQRFASSAGDFDKITAHVASSPTDVAAPAFDLEACRSLFPAGWVTAEFQAELDLVAQTAPVLTPGLSGSPRRTKRFLNTLLLRLAMGADRGLELKRRVLAKLMLLEYLKPEFFKQLARLQAAEQGKPQDLAAAEAAAASAPEPAAAPANKSQSGSKPVRAAAAVKQEPAISDQVQLWLADDWMRRWLTADPQLRDVDLGPYFYIAHDKLGAAEAVETRLSPAARAVLAKLLADGDASRAVGLSDASKLAAADVTAVFEILAGRARAADVDEARKLISTILKLAEARPDLVPQFIGMLESLPDTKVPISLPMSLTVLVDGKPTAPLARAIFHRWQASTIRTLAEATRAAAERLPG